MKKRANSGCMKERKTTWAPLQRCQIRSLNALGRSNVLGLGESHPEDKDELEDVVEWEPVDGVNSGLDNGQEGVDDPVL